MTEQKGIMNEEKNKFIKKTLNILFWFVSVGGALTTLIMLATLTYFNAFGGLFEFIIALAVAIVVFIVLNSFRKKIIKKIVGD